MAVNSALTNEIVELLQQMIRNKCVNDGSVASGQEGRTTDLLRTYFHGSGLDLELIGASRIHNRIPGPRIWSRPLRVCGRAD